MIEELRRMKQHQWRNVYKRWLAERLDVIDTIIFPDVERFVGQGNNFEYTGPITVMTARDVGNNEWIL